MTEIRDIRPTEPLWPKRRTEKIRQDEEREAPQQEKRQRRDDDTTGDDRSRDGGIDEYA